MAEPTERTVLLSTQNKPEYVFESANSRRKRVKKFQCCICAIFLSVFFSIISIFVIWKISFMDDQNITNTTINNTDKQLFTTNQLNFSIPLNDFHYKNVTINNGNEWEEAINAGKLELNKRDLIESVQPSLLLRSPSYRHQKVTATSEKARNISRIGYIHEHATRYIHQKYGHNTTKTLMKRICNNSQLELNVNCNKFQKYRSYNGTCNNLKFSSTYGVAYTPFRRALPPNYADGISMPRISETGNRLPSARTVSLIVHRPYYKDDNKFSVMLAVWGQFLDHDITATALSQKSNGSTISCCNNNYEKSPECFPVLLDSGDPFRNYNVDCIEFVRSAPASMECLGPREQLNQATSFIDGSVIYGVDQDTVNKLRTFNDGLLKMYITEDNRTLLPVSDDINDGCNREEQRRNGKYCFLTGDARANENLHLTSMHLLWARQHNLLAKKLSNLNPHWKDERVFQEARHIISGQMQHITYNEFLPILFGSNLMETYHLTPNMSDNYRYNYSINPSIGNYFATAAFRFAHTIIPGLMKLLANDTTSPEYIQLHKMLFDPFKLYVPGEMDKVLRGAMDTNIEASDPYFTNELKQHLFEKAGEKNHSVQLCGLDLVSLNIQRGRDHGLPGYTKWREYCRLEVPNSFNDLKNYMDTNSVDNIRSIYATVNDIDLYTGALSEIPINGSILGPTITCLLLDQFVRIKFGDRFWYENKNVFTPEQLNEIKKTTLANIICDNSDNVVYLQEKVMEKISSTNRNISCIDLVTPNFNLWKENLTHVSMSDKFLQVVLKN